jgi:hypothetical protein
MGRLVELGEGGADGETDGGSEAVEASLVAGGGDAGTGEGSALQAESRAATSTSERARMAQPYRSSRASATAPSAERIRPTAHERYRPPCAVKRPFARRRYCGHPAGVTVQGVPPSWGFAGSPVKRATHRSG